MSGILHDRALPLDSRMDSWKTCAASCAAHVVTYQRFWILSKVWAQAYMCTGSMWQCFTCSVLFFCFAPTFVFARATYNLTDWLWLADSFSSKEIGCCQAMTRTARKEPDINTKDSRVFLPQHVRCTHWPRWMLLVLHSPSRRPGSQADRSWLWIYRIFILQWTNGRHSSCLTVGKHEELGITSSGPSNLQWTKVANQSWYRLCGLPKFFR